MNVYRKVAGQVEINFAYHRHDGAKFNHGAVKIRFDSLQPYSFTSHAEWSENENYDKYVQTGVEKALIEITGSLENTNVTLLEIEFNEVDSSANGFKFAAYAATYAALLAYPK